MRTGRYSDQDVEHYDRPRRRTRPRTKERPTYDDAADGVVVTVDRGRYTLLVEGRVVTAMKARPLGRRGVVVGDRVRVEGDVSGDDGSLARIVEVNERLTTLRRTAEDDDPVERVIVANADQLVVVTALADPEPQPRLIDRALVAAYDAGLAPLLCLTKSDLASPGRAAGDLSLPGRPVGGHPPRRRPVRAPRAADRAGQRAAGLQRRREVDAGQRPGARRDARGRNRQRRHRPGPAHLHVGVHARPARTTTAAGSSTRRASGRSGWRTCSRRT